MEPIPNLDTQQQIEDFNQALLCLAEQQYQTLQQHLEARHWQVINDLEAEMPKRKSRKRSELPALLQSAITGARYWLIERLSALEPGETVESPLPDGKEVTVIDANYTVITPERKEIDDGITYSLERNERPGTAHQTGSGAPQGPNRPNQSSRSSGNQRGLAVTPDHGERSSNDPFYRPTGD